MKVRLEPISAIILAIVLGWGWNKATTDNRPICQVQEIHNGTTVFVPRYCDEVMGVKNGN